jgi:hypothetical protein
MGNPYLSFAAMMMAGLDGIQNKIHPGDAMDKDLYDLPPEEEKAIPQVCYSPRSGPGGELDKDREFLTAGGVFTDDVIDGYIALKMQEVTQLRMTTHPVEFDMYYSLNLNTAVLLFDLRPAADLHQPRRRATCSPSAPRRSRHRRPAARALSRGARGGRACARPCRRATRSPSARSSCVARTAS